MLQNPFISSMIRKGRYKKIRQHTLNKCLSILWYIKYNTQITFTSNHIPMCLLSFIVVSGEKNKLHVLQCCIIKLVVKLVQ